MKVINWISSLVIAIGMTACDAVLTKSPVSIDITDGLKGNLEGEWKNEEDDSILVKFSDKGEGEGSWTDDDKTERADLRAVNKGEWIYLSFLPKDTDSDETYWFFGACQLEDEDTLWIYLPVIKEFQNLISSGKLKGEVEKQRYSTMMRVDKGTDVVSVVSEDPEKFLKKGEESLKRVK